MSALERLKGTVFASGTRTLYVGPLVATARHSHHATQVVVAPEGVDLEDGADQRLRVHAAVIPPHMPHGHGACEHGALLFLDGDDLASRALARSAEPRGETWARTPLEVEVPRSPTPGQAQALIASVLTALDVCQPPGPRHPATRRMGAALDSSEPLDLASLALEAGLSPRQMRHAFARDFGLPMRAYVRWRRLRRAIAAVEEGASLSAAAASAGFADSAHLTRVFREQFGMTPSQGLSSVTWRTLD
ncbi:helix-turn-helix transcriptional regulator [Myxococcus stipitatus]|uniref:helix-turn-helix transcriptional regulator n=1 Tax=Myxococcus stipitatus TaxID=83455 RepID=UPI0002F01153|nr:helix-turn-helix domain-containing protein [Myxococcus stipitatus]